MMPDDLQQLWLPLGEPAQVALKQIPLSLDITPLMPALDERFERSVVDQAVRLGEARQATDRDLADRAAKPAHQNRDRLTERSGGVALVVSQRPQPMEPSTVRALRRRPDLLVVLLPDILLYRELHPYEPLHAARIQWRNEIERDISSLFERDQNETLNEIYNETKLIRLLLTGKGAVTPLGLTAFLLEQ